MDTIIVDYEPSDAKAHWHLLFRDDLEIAARMHIYHIKYNVTGKEKIGKFAMIK